mgnify:FL=1
MYMTKEKFDEIKRKHSTLLILDDDADETLEFVQELLEAEADALKEKCAYATKSIAEVENAVHQVFDMRREIDNECFGDGD